jgi:hypothetical protein
MNSNKYNAKQEEKKTFEIKFQVMGSQRTTDVGL